MANRKPGRPAVTSIALLQRLLRDREEELTQYREIVFAIVRHNGRVRIPRTAFDQAKVGDMLDVHPDGDHVVLEFGKDLPGPRLVPDAKPAPVLVTPGGNPLREGQ